MKVIHYSEADARTFDGENVKGVTARVLIGKADGATNFCMRIFELSPGGYTPRHAHGWEHEIFVHQGEGAVYSNGSWLPISTGKAIFVPAHEEHQIKNTGSEPLTFVCLIPSGFPEL